MTNTNQVKVTARQQRSILFSVESQDGVSPFVLLAVNEHAALAAVAENISEDLKGKMAGQISRATKDSIAALAAVRGGGK